MTVQEKVNEYFILNKDVLFAELNWVLLKDERKSKILRLKFIYKKVRTNRIKKDWAIKKITDNLGVNYEEAASIIDDKYLTLIGYID